MANDTAAGHGTYGRGMATLTTHPLDVRSLKSFERVLQLGGEPWTRRGAAGMGKPPEALPATIQKRAPGVGRRA